MSPCWRRIVPVVALVIGSSCNRTTGTLSDEHQKRFESEGIVRKAVDLAFRRTRLGDETRWDEGDASIVVTHQSVVIHSGDRFLLEITPRSTGEYRVARERDRVTIQGGRGQSRVSWSFRPSEDAEGWTEDVRAVIRNAAGERRGGDRNSTRTPTAFAVGLGAPLLGAKLTATAQ